jgi:hypothetical protein
MTVLILGGQAVLPNGRVLDPEPDETLCAFLARARAAEQAQRKRALLVRSGVSEAWDKHHRATTDC